MQGGRGAGKGKGPVVPETPGPLNSCRQRPALCLAAVEVDEAAVEYGLALVVREVAEREGDLLGLRHAFLHEVGRDALGLVLEGLAYSGNEDEIVERMLAEYDVSPEDARAGVADLLASLDSVGALEGYTPKDN